MAKIKNTFLSDYSNYPYKITPLKPIISKNNLFILSVRRDWILYLGKDQFVIFGLRRDGVKYHF